MALTVHHDVCAETQVFTFRASVPVRRRPYAELESLSTTTLIATLPRLETDQESAGRRLGPRWLQSRNVPGADAEVTRGVRDRQAPISQPIMMHGHICERALSGRAVAEVVERRALAAGLDPTRQELVAHVDGLPSGSEWVFARAWRWAPATADVAPAVLASGDEGGRPRETADPRPSADGGLTPSRTRRWRTGSAR
jgi:hypothetical protein